MQNARADRPKLLSLLLCANVDSPSSAVLIQLRTPLPATLGFPSADFPLPSQLQRPWHALIKLTALAHSSSGVADPTASFDDEPSSSGGGGAEDEVDEAVLLGLAEPLLDDLYRLEPLSPREKTRTVRLLALAIRGARRGSAGGGGFIDNDGGGGGGGEGGRASDRRPAEVLVERLGVFVVGWLRAQIPTTAAAAAAAARGGGEIEVASKGEGRQSTHGSALHSHPARHARFDIAPLPPPPPQLPPPLPSSSSDAVRQIATLVAESLAPSLTALDDRLTRLEGRLGQEVDVSRQGAAGERASSGEINGALSVAAVRGSDGGGRVHRQRQQVGETTASASEGNGTDANDDDGTPNPAIPADTPSAESSSSIANALLASLMLNILLLALAFLAFHSPPNDLDFGLGLRFGPSQPPPPPTNMDALDSARMPSRVQLEGRSVDVAANWAEMLALGRKWSSDNDDQLDGS